MHIMEGGWRALRQLPLGIQENRRPIGLAALTNIFQIILLPSLYLSHPMV